MPGQSCLIYCILQVAPLGLNLYSTATADLTHLEGGVVAHGAAGVERHVRHGARLAHHEHLHGLRDLAPRQHRRVHQLPALRGRKLLSMLKSYL